MARAEWNEVLELLRRAAVLGLRVALPARVTRVTREAGRVGLALEMLLPRPDPEVPPDAPPELLDVPVIYPSSAGCEVAFALAPGDRGLALFADHALGGWLQTGAAGPPPVLDPHGLSGAVFLPGLWPTGRQVAIPEQGVVVGVRGGEALEVVGDEVRGGRGASERLELHSSLVTLKAVFDGWTPVAQDGGAALKTALEAWEPQGTTVTKGK